ncbi:MAG: HAMP domain-containing sensor histidine kinase [Cyclobacteriaceae bacterium]
MKIRDKLSVSFGLSASITMMAFGIIIYFFFAHYRVSEFNNRLKQRIEVTEKMFLEKDNFSEEAFKTIQDQFLNKLPEETEEVLELSNDFRSQIKEDYPDQFINDLITKGEAFFTLGDKQGAGKVFNVNQKDYLVILTAVDYIGIRLMDHFLTIIFIGIATCIFIMILISYGVSGYILNPIFQKIYQANTISANNLNERLDVNNPDDELGQFAIAFNNLLDRLAEAFETQRSFIDSASHEIRNPLTIISGESEFALERPRSKEEYINSFKVITEEADRLNKLVNNLLKLSGINSKQATLAMNLISVREVLNSCLEKLNYLNADYNIHFESSETEEYLINGNAHLLETSFINLIENGCKFSYNKPVHISIRATKEEIIVSIKDEGIGIPAEDIPKLIQPFHRAYNARKIAGVGIGIPLTSKIMELHKGTMEFKSIINKGTEVIVTLPVAKMPSGNF